MISKYKVRKLEDAGHFAVLLNNRYICYSYPHIPKVFGKLTVCETSFYDIAVYVLDLESKLNYFGSITIFSHKDTQSKNITLSLFSDEDVITNLITISSVSFKSFIRNFQSPA